jgi:predicted dehydrogenase
MKVCLIGYGYWGKVLHKNLISMGINDVSIFDDVLGNTSDVNDSYDVYFVATPFDSHKMILDKLIEYKGKRIWCEKPLVDNIQQAFDLYQIAIKNGNLLFVDWVYTFNKCVDKIRSILLKKKVKFILLNRTNDGPSRADCSSVEDLSVHDLSILYHIFGMNYYFEFDWNEFSIKSHEQKGSNISRYYKDGLQIIINSSWQHKLKNRVSIFVTEDDEMITFDDSKKIVLTKDEVFTDDSSPLKNAIEFFLNSPSFPDNMEMTLKITKEIENFKRNRI